MEHLASIDAAAWPRVAKVPRGIRVSVKAQRAEKAFAKACEDAGVELEITAASGPDLLVEHDALFARIADSGWLGMAESYMAGEWLTPSSDKLVEVLTKLLRHGYSPVAARVPAEPHEGGEVPPELVTLYSGDGISPGPGIFATGVPTTVRESVPSFAPGAGRGREPKEHFVDITYVSEPSVTEREDLPDAQGRNADWMLDSAHVGAGTHVLVYPGSGARAAVNAVGRRGIIDVLGADTAQLEALREYFVLAGVDDGIHVQDIPEAIPHAKDWRGRYEAIVSVDFLTTLGPRQRRDYFAALDRLLMPGGRAVLSGLVAAAGGATGKQLADASLSALRAYVWPGLHLDEATDVHKVCDRSSGLRIIAQAHLGAHAQASLRLQREIFEGRLREAAAAGFDPVFRRLWVFQFAIREALLAAGLVDYVHFTATHRNRGGRR